MIPTGKMARIIISVLLCAALLAGCTLEFTADAPSPDSDVLPGDISAVYDETTAARIQLGDGISVSGSGAEVQRNVITLFKGGTYIFEGTLSDGQIVVNADDSHVHIVFRNMSLGCSYSAPLYILSAALVTLTLDDGTENFLSDADSRPADDSINGVLYSKAPLAINGSGSLTVTGAYKHGISVRDAFTLCGGSLCISAPKTGMDCRGDITLTSCSLNIDAGSNGIRAGREDSPANIYLQSGTYSLFAAGDGMHSYGNIDISGGELNITTGGGSSEAAIRYSGHIAGIAASQDTTTADDTSRKGIKASGDIALSGGRCSIDSYDDGIHSDGDIILSAGTHSISSGDDGVHSEGALTVSGGNIDIPYCYEGLEGSSVTVTAGSINICANDDGINTVSDEDDPQQQPLQSPDTGNAPEMPGENIPPGSAEFGQSSPPGGTMEPPAGFSPPDNASPPRTAHKPAAENSGSSGTHDADEAAAKREASGKIKTGQGGFGGMQDMTPQDGVDITISGGTVTIAALGDCMDSNGSIYITGGTVYVSTAQHPVIGFAEAGLDCNGSFTLSGGSLIGTGTSASQTDGLQDGAIAYYSESVFEENTPIALYDSTGIRLLGFTPVYSFNSILLSSPMLVQGETYTLTAGETTEAIQLTEQVVTVGESTDSFGARQSSSFPAAAPSAPITSASGMRYR